MAAATAWVRDRTGQLGIDAEAISLLGYSSGAHLVALASTDPRYLGAHGMRPGDLAAVVPLDVNAYDVPRAIATACDLGFCLASRNLPAIFGEDPAVQRRLSPMTYVAPGLPPFLIVSAGIKDGQAQTLSLDQSIRFRDALRAVGGVADNHHEPSFGHTDLIPALVDPNSALHDRVLAFLASPSAPVTPNDGCTQLRAALTQAFDDATTNLAGPGGVIAAVDTPCGLWTDAAGAASPNEPMTTEHYVRIGSVTKTYTAALALRLVEQGRLSLFGTLDQFLPRFPNAGAITIRQLLGHESGLGDIVDDQDFMADAFQNPTQPITPVELIQTAAMQPTEFAPGTSYAYSNTNYILLGVIIQQVTGRPYAASFADLTAEVSLDDTIFETDLSALPLLARGYGQSGTDATEALHPTIRFSAGAVAATVPDVARWGTALYAGDVLTDPSKQAMREGLGAFVDGSVLGHGGTAPGFHTQLKHDDATGRTVAVTSTFDAMLPRVLADRLLEVAQ